MILTADVIDTIRKQYDLRDYNNYSREVDPKLWFRYTADGNASANMFLCNTDYAKAEWGESRHWIGQEIEGDEVYGTALLDMSVEAGVGARHWIYTLVNSKSNILYNYSVFSSETDTEVLANVRSIAYDNICNYIFAFARKLAPAYFDKDCPIEIIADYLEEYNYYVDDLRIAIDNAIMRSS